MKGGDVGEDGGLIRRASVERIHPVDSKPTILIERHAHCGGLPRNDGVRRRQVGRAVEYAPTKRTDNTSLNAFEFLARPVDAEQSNRFRMRIEELIADDLEGEARGRPVSGREGVARRARIQARGQAAVRLRVGDRSRLWEERRPFAAPCVHQGWRRVGGATGVPRRAASVAPRYGAARRTRNDEEREH